MELPVYWVNVHKDPLNQPFRDHIRLDTSTVQQLQSLITASSTTSFRILEAYRVEDSGMWCRYIDFKRSLVTSGKRFARPNEVDGIPEDGQVLTEAALAMEDEDVVSLDNLDPTVNEELLWHGTSQVNAEAIAEVGFHISGAHPHGARFGEGAYFAEDLAKSVSYCSSGKYVLLCRVLIGAIYYTESSSEECAHIAAKGSGKHSVLANPGRQGPREFIVLDEAQVYPEFVLKLE